MLAFVKQWVSGLQLVISVFPTNSLLRKAKNCHEACFVWFFKCLALYPFVYCSTLHPSVLYGMPFVYGTYLFFVQSLSYLCPLPRSALLKLTADKLFCCPKFSSAKAVLLFSSSYASSTVFCESTLRGLCCHTRPVFLYILLCYASLC